MINVHALIEVCRSITTMPSLSAKLKPVSHYAAAHLRQKRTRHAFGDITHEPMRGATLVRRSRIRRRMPQHAAAT